MFKNIRSATLPLLVNGRSYRSPTQPTVVVCVDGCEPDYIGLAVAGGHMPWIKKTLQTGVGLVADCVIPSFTNPNNISIVTGAPPSVHGICGNYFFDASSQSEVMMNNPVWMRAPTILAALAETGHSVAVVTAKDKLRRMLGHQLRGICFSAERADEAAHATHGIDGVLNLVGRPLPTVYSAELSEFVMAAGVRLIEERLANVLYLSTTDYVQHKHAPGSAEANVFYSMLDSHLDKLDTLGCVITLTADHGMNSKIGLDGAPQVVYLQDWCDTFLGKDIARVILPITDPYVAHHGSLGSFATIYLPADADVDTVCKQLTSHEGMDLALLRADAADRFALPADRIGDVVVIGNRSTVFGTSASRHDLSGLDSPLRSHGGVTEQRVPLIVNRPLQGIDRTRRFRNFDAFDLALNYAQ